MTDVSEEEKKAADLAEAEAKKAKEKEDAAARANETEEEKKAREEKEAKDEEARLQAEHEAELKIERERTKKAEDALAKKRFEESEAKRKRREAAIAAGETPEEDDDEKPLTRSELEDVLSREREAIRRENQAEVIKEKVKKITSSDIETELVMEIHKNRQFPAGMPLDEQIEEAYLIANRKRILGVNTELKRALQHKDTTNKGVADTHRDSPSPSEPKLSANDDSLLKRSGFVWDGKKNAFKKETAMRIIFKSRDLKKTWTEPKK